MMTPERLPHSRNQPHEYFCHHRWDWMDLKEKKTGHEVQQVRRWGWIQEQKEGGEYDQNIQKFQRTNKNTF